jgi:hypothetical protein
MVQMIQNDEMGRMWKGVVNCVLWWYPRIFLEAEENHEQNSC